jgi:hypothetical protein
MKSKIQITPAKTAERRYSECKEYAMPVIAPVSDLVETEKDLDNDPVILSKLRTSERQLRTSGLKHMTVEEAFAPIEKKIDDFIASHPEL